MDQVSTFVDQIPRAPADWGQESIDEYMDAQEENRRMEQRLDALALGNRYRSAVARERARIAALSTEAGCAALAEIIETATDPALLSGRVLHYLGAVRYWGQCRALRVARRGGLKDNGIRLRDLDDAERTALAAAVRSGS